MTTVQALSSVVAMLKRRSEAHYDCTPYVYAKAAHDARAKDNVSTINYARYAGGNIDPERIKASVLTLVKEGAFEIVTCSDDFATVKLSRFTGKDFAFP